MLIYVAGPLSGPNKAAVERNIRAGCEVGTALIKMGHQPIVPHLSWYWEEFNKEVANSIAYEEWLAYDFEMIRRCDALFYIASSPGADRELELALGLNIPVYYQLEDVPPLLV